MAKLSSVITANVPTEIMASAGYICVPSATAVAEIKNKTKTLSTLSASDMVKLAKFVEGTFSPSGDEAETTVLKYSDGSSYYTLTTEGTTAYDGEIPSFSSEAISYLFGSNYKSIVVDDDGKAAVDGGTAESTGTFTGDLLKGYTLGAISGAGKVEGIPLFIETLQGDYDFMLFPNATITASMAGSLDSDGTATWALNITANAYVAKSGEGGENSNLDGVSVIYGKTTPPSQS